ncbi:MAG: restriction endonuclease, partial [Gammaproteobacteria bacterium]|nr:restriction endonuclease [Gammaproteobacteria bacterium]
AMRTDSREFEQLVARIQRQLAPDAEVYHDVKLEGRTTGRKRQVDVLVTQLVGQYEIRIIVECKDYARPVDVKGVETFYGLLDDVGAQKGVLVCPSGFTGTAKARAEGLQIDLYSPVDTEPHKWQAKVAVPALCDFRSAAMSFGIATSGPYPFRMPYDFYQQNQLYDDEGNHRGTALENAVEKWNDGKYPTEVGEHRNLPVLDSVTANTDNGYGMIVPADFSVSLVVRKELYFGQFPITELSGFKDELRGRIITNAFTVGLLSPEEVERQWKKTPDVDKAPVKPVVTLTGLVCWIA